MDRRIHALDHLARSGASARALRVAITLYSRAVAGQTLTGPDLARILDLHKSQVSRALGELTEAGVLARTGRKGPIALRDDVAVTTPIVAETAGCASRDAHAAGQTAGPEVATTATTEVAETATTGRAEQIGAGEVAATATAEVATTATTDPGQAGEVATTATTGPEVAATATASRACAQRERDTPNPKQEQGTSLPAGAGAHESPIDQPIDGARIRKIIEGRGFPWQRIMQGSTTRLVAEWAKAKITERELKTAIEKAEEVTRGRPDSPVYYQWAVNDVLKARDGSAQKSPQTGVAPAGSDQQQNGRRPSGDSVNDLYAKDYTSGATGTDELPEFLR